MKNIQIIPLARREEMRKYFYDYLIELAQFDDEIMFDESGTPIYKWFEYYWQDKDRYPIYLIIDNKVAGLAMIREVEDMINEIAEFYVLPEYRKDGNAMWFAGEVTRLFEGQFIYSTKFTNSRAIRFWDKFSASFESNEHQDDEVWRTWTIRKIKK